MGEGWGNKIENVIASQKEGENVAWEFQGHHVVTQWGRWETFKIAIISLEIRNGQEGMKGTVEAGKEHQVKQLRRDLHTWDQTRRGIRERYILSYCGEYWRKAKTLRACSHGFRENIFQISMVKPCWRSLELRMGVGWKYKIGDVSSR